MLCGVTAPQRLSLQTFHKNPRQPPEAAEICRQGGRLTLAEATLRRLGLCALVKPAPPNPSPGNARTRPAVASPAPSRRHANMYDLKC